MKNTDSIIPKPIPDEKTVFTEDQILESDGTVNTEKKTIFLIGDSITVGYRETVRRELDGFANVVYPDENGRCTQYVIVSLRRWSGLCDPEKVDLVQFNCGHWDVAHWNDEEVSLTPLPVYRENIARIFETLRRVFRNAKIVFATTTRMNPDGTNSKNVRTTEEIIRYNAAALDALKGRDVTVNDLFAFVEDFPPEAFRDHCHFKPETNAVIGAHCASLFRELLKQPEIS